MSTDSPIPERWLPAYNKAKALIQGAPSQPIRSANPQMKAAIEELGTAESLVRDLARALKLCHAESISNAPYAMSNIRGIIAAVWSRIPTHLRAPEPDQSCEYCEIHEKGHAYDCPNAQD